MILSKLPPDKALHAIAGGVLAALGAASAILAGYPQFAWLAAMALATLGGVGKEIKDRATPGRHVSVADALATALGGVPVAVPLLLKGGFPWN